MMGAMARPLRIEMADGVYHVTSRGLERREIVRDDRDRARWLEMLGEVAARREWRVLAWALMDNHFHLFLRTPRPDLSAGMHDLNSGYATRFNRRHGRVGPLLQGRFKAIIVESRYHYWELSRYVHLNPVRAGLAANPQAYPWSSCAAYFRERGVPDWLAPEEVLCEHGRTVRAARAQYARFLAEGVASPPPSPLRQVVAATVLGSERFVERIRRWLGTRRPDREVPAARRLLGSVGVADVEAEVARAWAVPVESLRVRGTRRSPARAVALHLCRRLTREPVARLGERFGGISAQAVCNLVARVVAERRSSCRLDARLAAIEQALRLKCRM